MKLSTFYMNPISSPTSGISPKQPSFNNYSTNNTQTARQSLSKQKSPIRFGLTSAQWVTCIGLPLLLSVCGITSVLVNKNRRSSPPPAHHPRYPHQRSQYSQPPFDLESGLQRPPRSHQPPQYFDYELGQDDYSPARHPQRLQRPRYHQHP